MMTLEFRISSKVIERVERIELANEFFIRKGVEVCQYQVNNPKQRSMPRTLVGHGLQLAAEHLGIKSGKWAAA